MEETTMFIGLDVHKATIAVAIAEGGRREAARYFGEIENTPAALSKLAKKYRRANARLSFCYEAGPCGYGVHRHLVGLGHECLVVAPSLMSARG
jgi:transposase